MKASNPLFDRDQGNWSSRKSIDRSPTRVAKSNRICNKKQNKKKPGEIIKSWWWCCVHLLLPLLALSPHPDAYIFYSVSLASSRPVSFAPRFTTSLRDELSWFCFTFNIFFYILYQTREKGKKLRSRWYSIGIGWLNLFLYISLGRWSARGFQHWMETFNATRCLCKWSFWSIVFRWGFKSMFNPEAASVRWFDKRSNKDELQMKHFHDSCEMCDCVLNTFPPIRYDAWNEIKTSSARTLKHFIRLFSGMMVSTFFMRQKGSQVFNFLYEKKVSQFASSRRASTPGSSDHGMNNFN